MRRTGPASERRSEGSLARKRKRSLLPTELGSRSTDVRGASCQRNTTRVVLKRINVAIGALRPVMTRFDRRSSRCVLVGPEGLEPPTSTV